MKLKQTVTLPNGVKVPVGTELHFGNEGFGFFAGKQIKSSDIPDVAIESDQRLAGSLRPKDRSPYGVVLKHGIKLTSGTIVPKGTCLQFGTEGYSFFNGEQVSIYGIPTYVIEMDESISSSTANLIDSSTQWTPFDDVKPGDQGVDPYGKPVTILGKAVGPDGFASLVKEFGNAGSNSWESITGASKCEPKDIMLVAYTDTEGIVNIDEYCVDVVAGTESDNGNVVSFDNVEPGDEGVDSDGKPVVIYAKGKGKVQYEKMCAAFDLDNCWSQISETLGDKDPDDFEFVYYGNKDGLKAIDAYGDDGVKIFVIE